MAKHTLLLNADYQPYHWSPLSSVSWQTAINAVYLDRVTVLDYYDKEVHSPSTTMKIPSVIVTKQYYKTRQRLNPTRENIYQRDNFMCQYCLNVFGTNNLTLDHVIPKCKGGNWEWTNLVTSCKKCNNKKGHLLKMVPNSAPREMQYWESVSLIKEQEINIPDLAWQKYIQWPNDKVKLYTPDFFNS